MEVNSVVDMLEDKRFPQIDVALRKGIHITDDDIENYEFLVETREYAAQFYGKYGAELIYDPEGYIFLSPKDGVFRQGRLRAGEMILGQLLVLFLSDPKSLRDGGRIKFGDILIRLTHLLPNDQLALLFYAQKRRKSRTDIDEKKLKENVEKSLRLLGSLGFVHLSKDGFVRPLKSIYRFAPFARTTQDREDVESDLTAKSLLSKLEEGSIYQEDEDKTSETEASH